MSINNIGKKVGEIPVELNFHIIKLLSAGLYSSPNKAFEELVSNSYDAGATKVATYTPYDISIANAMLWVCDNGVSMDSDGLKNLWQIGSSSKRENETTKRLPIGKFGIGKLATYVLARELTYICKDASGQLRAVTMDYKSVDEAKGSQNIKLAERTLTEEEAKQVLNPLIKVDGKDLLDFKLWGTGSEKTWTFAIMSDLRPKAHDIEDGRLKWILRTALPLNPNFQLFHNGVKLTSAKDDLTPSKTFIFGKDDEVVEKTEEYSSREEGDVFYVDLPTLKGVSGRLDYFDDTLAKEDKASRWGRSHGIFLMVRERLINLNDALLGMQEMTYGVFNRIRIIVHANGLDQYITSTRENVTDSEALEDLKTYIKKKFSEIRKHHFELMDAKEKAGQAKHKIANVAGSISRRPLVITAKRFFDKEINELYLTDIPKNLNDKEKKEILERLEADLTSDSGIIKDVEWAIMDPSEPVAKLDLVTGKAQINMLHPFFANFAEAEALRLPFQLMAISEILTEAHLVEIGQDQETIINTMKWRDGLLRELTYNERKSTPLIASIVKACLNDPSGLEVALTDAFNNLGFKAIKLGGPGKPDGIATAELGYKNVGDATKADYKFTYDAKSTSKEKIKATHAHISGLKRHRTDYNADFSICVAIDFEGADDPESAVNKEAAADNICLIKAADLITLLFLSVPKQIGFAELKDLFGNHFKVMDTSKWINDWKSKEDKKHPIKELIETIHSLSNSDKEPPTISAIRMLHPELKKLGIPEIKTMIEGLQRFVGGYISLSSDGIISLNSSPEKILEAINISMSADIPLPFQDAFEKYFGERKDSKG